MFAISCILHVVQAPTVVAWSEIVVLRLEHEHAFMRLPAAPSLAASRFEFG